MIAALTQGHLRKTGWLLAMALVAVLAWNMSPAVADSHCIDTGFDGLTAVSVNEDVADTTITGAKTSGWAENGIQVDQGANATVVNNTVEGHWWDGESNWASTGIFVFGADGLSVTNNRLVDNEFGFYIIGDNNKVSGNRTSSEIISESSLEFQAYGMLIAGSNNHAAGNSLSATGGAVGIYIYPGAAGNKVTGNRIGGFDFLIVDGGNDTLNRGNPSQFN